MLINIDKINRRSFEDRTGADAFVQRELPTVRGRPKHSVVRAVVEHDEQTHARERREQHRTDDLERRAQPQRLP